MGFLIFIPCMWQRKLAQVIEFRSASSQTERIIKMLSKNFELFLRKFPFRIIGIIPHKRILATFKLKEYWQKIHVKHYLVQLAVPPLRNLGRFQTDLAETLKQETLLLCGLVGCYTVEKNKNSR